MLPSFDIHGDSNWKTRTLDNWTPLESNKNQKFNRIVFSVQKPIQLGYEALPRPAYSSDLSPNNFHLHRHLDNRETKRLTSNQQLKMHSKSPVIERLQNTMISRYICQQRACKHIRPTFYMPKSQRQKPWQIFIFPPIRCLLRRAKINWKIYHMLETKWANLFWRHVHG